MKFFEKIKKGLLLTHDDLLLKVRKVFTAQRTGDMPIPPSSSSGSTLVQLTKVQLTSQFREARRCPRSP